MLNRMHRLYTPQAQRETAEFLDRPCEHKWYPAKMHHGMNVSFVARFYCSRCGKHSEEATTPSQSISLLENNGVIATPKPTAPTCANT